MQQTRLDAWLKTRFAYFYEIHCLKIPKIMPPNVEVKKSMNSTTMWRLIIVCQDDPTSQLVIAAMVRERLSYNLVTRTKKAWWVKHLNPPNKGSFTYTCFWRLLNASVVSGLLFVLPFTYLSKVGAAIKGLIGAEFFRSFMRGASALKAVVKA